MAITAIYIGGRTTPEATDLLYVYDSVDAANPAQGIYALNPELLQGFIASVPDYSMWPDLSVVQPFTRGYGTNAQAVATALSGHAVATKIDSGNLSIIKIVLWALSVDDYGITGFGLAGEPDDQAAPLVPVIEASGTIDSAFVDFEAGLALTPATASELGAVAISGTPADAEAPTVPCVTADGFIESSSIDGYALMIATPATGGAAGGVVIIGTPADVEAPIVPVVEAAGVEGTTATPVTVTTASLVGKTMTFVNGLLQDIS